MSANATEPKGSAAEQVPESVSLSRSQLSQGQESPSCGTKLWHGLLTVPLFPTAGLPRSPRTQGRPSVRGRGTVRRPCHNLRPWHGQETVPQLGPMPSPIEQVAPPALPTGEPSHPLLLPPSPNRRRRTPRPRQRRWVRGAQPAPVQ